MIHKKYHNRVHETIIKEISIKWAGFASRLGLFGANHIFTKVLYNNEGNIMSYKQVLTTPCGSPTSYDGAAVAGWYGPRA